MAPATLRCPGCSATLAIEASLPVSKSIRCPRCGTAFALPTTPPEAASIVVAPAPIAFVVPTAPGKETVPVAIPLGPVPVDAIQPAQAIPLAPVPQAFPVMGTANVRSVGRTVSPRMWIGIGVGVAAFLFLGMVTLGLLVAFWVSKPRTIVKEERVASPSTRPVSEIKQRPAPEPIQMEPPPPVAIANPQPLRTLIAIDKVTPKNAWVKQTMVDAYDKVGVKNPSWDDPARRLIRLQAESWDYPFRNYDDMQQPFEAADKARCNDPMYLYALARVTDDGFGHDRVAELMEKSAYHPVHRCFAALRAMRWFEAQAPNTERQRHSDRHLAVVEKLLPEIAKDPSVPPAILMELCEKLEEHYLLTAKDRKSAFDKVMERFAKAGPEGAGLLAYRGKFYVRFAWVARGSGWANSVTQTGWRLFAERLALAEQSLEKAWELDPNDAAAATAMIAVEMGQHQGRERMELWFRRAMQADPDNYVACEKKILYLQPRWHGNAAELLAFGHECLETQNWRGRLPHLLLDVHESVASEWGGGEEQYFHQPEVWADIQAVLGPFTKKYPRVRYWRSRYAYWACRCGHWVEAHRQLVQLGKDVHPEAFGGADRLEDFRQEAARHAGVKAGPLPDAKVETKPAVPEPPRYDLAELQRRMAKGELARLVVDGVDFKPFAEGNPLPFGGQNWKAVPDWLKGTSYTLAKNGSSGVLNFRVESDGFVLMAASPRWLGGGNRSGGWLEECKTRADLLADNWREVVSLPSTMGDWTLFVRPCRKAESFRIRTEKYLAPILLIPAKDAK